MKLNRFYLATGMYGGVRHILKLKQVGTLTLVATPEEADAYIVSADTAEYQDWEKWFLGKFDEFGWPDRPVIYITDDALYFPDSGVVFLNSAAEFRQTYHF